MTGLLSRLVGGRVLVTVTGPSMEPTYVDGDRVWVKRLGLSAVRHGDVVVLRSPLAGDAQDWMIKRVAALPGDPIPFEVAPILTGLRDRTGHVPANRIVVLGDNPAVSQDSRHLGYFGPHQLLGVVYRRYAGRR